MKRKLLIIIIVLSLLWIGVFTMFSLSSRESLTLSDYLVKEWRRNKTTETFYFIRYIYQVIIGLIFGLWFFLIPKKYLISFKFSILFFLITLIFLLLNLFGWTWETLNWETGRVYLFWISFMPIYLYIIWSILLLVNFLSINSSGKEQIKMKTKWLSFILKLPSFFTKLPLFIKYLIIQILISVPVILVPDLSNLILLWTMGMIIFFFSKQTWKIKYLLLAIALSAIWLVSTCFTNRYEYILNDALQCWLFANNKTTTPICYNHNKTQLAISRWGLIWVWHWNWQLNKEVPNVINNLHFAWIWEEFWKLWLLFLMSVYVLLFRIIFKKTKREDDNSRLTIIWLWSYMLLPTLFHILVNIWLLPFIWFNLSFISYWLSQLVAQMIAIGIILKIR